MSPIRGAKTRREVRAGRDTMADDDAASVPVILRASGSGRQDLNLRPPDERGLGVSSKSARLFARIRRGAPSLKITIAWL
jgi:hypothetical protein